MRSPSSLPEGESAQGGRAAAHRPLGAVQPSPCQQSWKEALPNTVNCERRSAWREEEPWELEDSPACHRHGAAVGTTSMKRETLVHRVPV